jgi:polyhydroxybutyrate depolymerase
VTRRPGAARLACIAAVLAQAACSRVDVYPITRDPPAAGGAGAGNAGAAGRGGASGAGGTAGNGGLAGNATSGAGGGTSACPSPALAPGDSRHTVEVGDVTRSYLLHVPELYDGTTPRPLVVAFHGIGESGESERANSGYPDVLDPENVVMAFPDGLRGPAGAGWNVGPCCVADVDDVAFARALVTQIEQTACIDTRRVYAVGVLTGGGLAHYLGCHAADVFAAVAPASFDLLEENVDDCQPARPISVISFRGTGEGRVPYEGGASSLVPGMPLTFLGAEASFERWAEIDGCTDAASAPDADGCSRYSACDDGAEVILCTEEGAGDVPGDPNIAWPVLARHSL